jgi:nucleoside-diphosphate-sugar epimerase
MNVLVTGGGGYIGSVLVRRLVREGYGVRVLDRFFFGEESLRMFGEVEMSGET